MVGGWSEYTVLVFEARYPNVLPNKSAKSFLQVTILSFHNFCFINVSVILTCWCAYKDRKHMASVFYQVLDIIMVYVDIKHCVYELKEIGIRVNQYCTFDI